jgi:hypothetical protein
LTTRQGSCPRPGPVEGSASHRTRPRCPRVFRCAAADEFASSRSLSWRNIWNMCFKNVQKNRRTREGQDMRGIVTSTQGNSRLNLESYLIILILPIYYHMLPVNNSVWRVRSSGGIAS